MRTTRLKSLNEFDLNQCYIAGGAVLSRVTKSEINDWDVYPKSREAILDICVNLLESGAFVVNISDRAITFKHNKHVNQNEERSIIQVMTFDEFNTPEKIFDFFDFSVCMGAYDCDEDTYHFHDDFWVDVAAKNLRFNPNTRFPLASLIRVSKYKSKGYEIGRGELAKIGMAVAQVGMPTSWEELSNQIGGVYGKSLMIDVDEEEFSIDKAFDVLSELNDNVVYSNDDDYSDVDETIIDMMFGGPNRVLYQLENAMFQIVDGDLIRFNSSNKGRGKIFELIDNDVMLDKKDKALADLINVNVKPITESPVKHIKAWRRVKKTDVEGVYEGVVYHGNKNGVTYSVNKETRWDKEPYLFFSPKKNPIREKNVVLLEVKIPIEDLVSYRFSEYKAKSCFVTDVVYKGE